MEERHDIELHERITSVETKVDTIINNHLAHLDAKIDKVDSKVDKVDSKVDKVDERQWYILTAIIISTLIAVGLAIWFK